MSSIKSLDSSIDTTEKVLAVLKPALALLGKTRNIYKMIKITTLKIYSYSELSYKQELFLRFLHALS